MNLGQLWSLWGPGVLVGSTLGIGTLSIPSATRGSLPVCPPARMWLVVVRLPRASGFGVIWQRRVVCRLWRLVRGLSPAFPMRYGLRSGMVGYSLSWYDVRAHRVLFRAWAYPARAVAVYGGVAHAIRGREAGELWEFLRAAAQENT